MITKVISGGQIGADIAGLRAAKNLGIETGGWIPKGCRTLDGDKPEWKEEFHLTESSDFGYPTRTKANIQASHGTIRFAVKWETPGERLTARLCRELGKPTFDVSIGFHQFDIYTEPEPIKVKEWIDRQNITILNVAGNARTDIEYTVTEYLMKVFGFYENLSY